MLHTCSMQHKCLITGLVRSNFTPWPYKVFMALFTFHRNYQKEEHAKAVPIYNIREVSEHSSFHSPISGEEAESLLKHHGSNCYLTRYNDSTHSLLLSVLATRKEDATPIFQHFQINVHAESGSYQYEIDGFEETFDNFSKLLDFYQKNPVSDTISCIGECIKPDMYERQSFAIEFF